MIQGVLQSTFLRLSSIVFVGNLLSQILIFIAYALFARYFDRIEIGIYTVFISLSILLAVPSTGRYELASMLPKQLKDSSGLLKIALGATFLKPKGVSTKVNTLSLKIGYSSSLIASKFLTHLSRTALSVSGKSS